MINVPLLRHTLRTHRLPVALIALALGVWGFLMPVIYATFGVQMEALLTSGIIPEAFLRLLGADPFSLRGAVALGSVHPIALGLQLIYPVGFAAIAIAGERQRGTLEVTLARPLSRQTLYLTLLAACFGFVGVAIACLLTGGAAGATFSGVIAEIDLWRMPTLWLNGVLLFGAFAAIGLAASVTFDRVAPALGWTLGIGLVMYVLEVLGSLWPDAEFLQPYSLFHYLQAKAILTGQTHRIDLAVLAGIIGAAVLWALVVFPRRDLAAPS